MSDWSNWVGRAGPNASESLSEARWISPKFASFWNLALLQEPLTALMMLHHVSWRPQRPAKKRCRHWMELLCHICRWLTLGWAAFLSNTSETPCPRLAFPMYYGP